MFARARAISFNAGVEPSQLAPTEIGEAAAAPAPAAPSLESRLNRLSGRGQLALGLGLVAAILALFFALEAAYGHFGAMPDGRPAWASPLLWQTTVFALIIGYLPISYGLGARGGVRDAVEIRPLLRCSDAEFTRLLGADERGVLPTPRAMGAVGLAIGLAVSCAAVGPERFFSPSTWDHHFVWLLVLCMLLFFGVGHIIHVSVRSSLAFNKLESVPMQLDLLDHRPLAPYVRTGLRNALLWLVGVSISLLLFFGERGEGHQIGVLIAMLFLSTGVATVVFVLPLRGVHRRIRQAKEEELARVHRAIDGDADALAGSRLAARARDLSLADLVAYRGLVASVREWPFERSALRRFALYLALPLGSWVGGALVERGLGLFLD